MADSKTGGPTSFDIPEPMRVFADKSVDQAKKAFDDYMSATAQAIAKAEDSAKSMQDGARDANRRALAFVEQNVSAAFDFARQMVRATTIEEIGALQQDFLQRQAESAQAHAREIADFVGGVAGEMTGKSKL